MFHKYWERREAWLGTEEIIQSGKIEPGEGSWSSPSFPVPKKNQGEYRLVEGFRRLNDAREDNTYPLLRIENKEDTKYGAY